jgi:hypothetical protein
LRVRIISVQPYVNEKTPELQKKNVDFQQLVHELVDVWQYGRYISEMNSNSAINDQPYVWFWNKIRYRLNDIYDDRLWGQSFNGLRGPLDTQLWEHIGSHIRNQLDEDHGY